MSILMKNQFFGDEKDYLTYGLLRTLARASGLRMGIAWMLTPDRLDGKGELRKYLSSPAQWQAHDPELFELLGRVAEHGRNIELAERFALIPEACYFGELVPLAAGERRAYFQRLFAALRSCPLLFLDPDNGLETRTAPRAARRSDQHVYWDELEEAYTQRGHSLLVFQHFPRRSREAYLAEMAEQYARRLGAQEVSWFQTAQVVFFLIARPEHAAALCGAPAAVAVRWGARIRPGKWGLAPEAGGTAPLPGKTAASPASAGLNLALLPERLAVCRLAPDAATPAWVSGELTAVTRSAEELSIVCAEVCVPAEVRAERGWRALKVAGPLDFGLVGILAALASPLAAAGISIFAISTYDTDYLLLKEERLPLALETLRKAGHHLR
jgi:hypothetical protein